MNGVKRQVWSKTTSSHLLCLLRGIDSQFPLFRNLVDKFRETGSVDDAKRCGRPRKLSEEKMLDISDSVMQSPSKSLRKLAQQRDIGLGTAHKAVKKKLKLFPYKIMAAQALEATDNEKRIRY
ncbi:uncharacterized protein LOC143248124 [Tachypleus tridentatus]|uniref:uncharacterized protein LOC143248124 n=1 Tax=Tachypleus tridentatus TaxID=6853 RepID=UPI003FD530D1